MKRHILCVFLALILLFSACAAPEPAAQPVEAPKPEPPEPQPEAAEPIKEELPEEPPVQEEPTEAEKTEGVLEIVTVSEPEVRRVVPEGVITRVEDMPRIDGSTACVPLMQKVLEQACSLSGEAAEPYYTASGTQNCWDLLYNADADLVLAYEMPKKTAQLYSSSALDMTSIGRDALVFLVNEQNPIKNLTRRQLIDIYTGKITNWAQLGGENEEIHPIQRDESSGSQTLFRKLLMQDVEPMEPPKEFRISSMDFLVEEIAGYDNAKNDLGFSVYYYVSQMKNLPGVRLLSVDGVMPSNETIQSGEYPLTNDFYAAIRADTKADSGTAALYRWIISDEGRKTLIEAGYVPAG